MSTRPLGLFVTGTDTDIGKTYVSRLLADTLAESMTVTYMKPIQTGCEGDKLSSPDFDFVMAGKAKPVVGFDIHVPYRFAPACSPHLAADLAKAKPGMM